MISKGSEGSDTKSGETDTESQGSDTKSEGTDTELQGSDTKSEGTDTESQGSDTKPEETGTEIPDPNGISYVEKIWNGTEVVSVTKTAEAKDVPADGSMTDGWYYLNSNDTKKNRISSITGDVNLILGDRSTLDVRGLYVPAGSTLTIYGQSEGTGKIYSHPTGGDITIYGGTITIYGENITTYSRDGAGIGGGCDGAPGTVIINDGRIRADGGSGAGIGGF